MEKQKQIMVVGHHHKIILKGHSLKKVGNH